MLGPLIQGKSLVICDACGISAKYDRTKYFVAFSKDIHICEDCLQIGAESIKEAKQKALQKMEK